ncbi:hypothetical protein AMAG_06556 [Allomyces macrogynus ATCC 38327]|uniref:Uncharacterized protein n=1 Tax=Allomyces macrogynus (strain ATCC 38327) TaxID=578462 RepID=A0A0L0SGX1_ALLM3|nr:hypothetical protein AMAG_06556 [Allomyces macrogynus ATCC 38327]|eukprot:KNE61756.1 hypothetical protein AMAG_06556 [Allomyces macrogynus ATCC 38327]
MMTAHHSAPNAPASPGASTTPPPAASTAPKIYFDLGNAKVRSRFKWIGKYMPGHCFLCTACLSRETAEYPCQHTAAGRICPIAREPTNCSRSMSVRVCLKTTGAKCLALLAESPYWNATKAHVRREAGEDAGFGIVVCKRQCLARWRSADAEDEGKLDDSNDRVADSDMLSLPSSMSRFPLASRVLARERAVGLDRQLDDAPVAPRRRRASSVDLAADLTPSMKRARSTSAATRPPPPPGPHSTIVKQPPLTSTANLLPTAGVVLASQPSPTTLASSPWMMLALGHMHLQASMAHVTTLRTRLSTLERMHALGYDKSDVQRVLAGKPTGDLAPGVSSV